MIPRDSRLTRHPDCLTNGVHLRVCTQLADVAISMRYGTSVKCEYATKGVPVLRIPNVSGGKIALDDIKFGPLSPAEAADLSLRTGDILLIRSNGSLEIVGRAAVVTSDAEGMSFAGYLVRLRTNTSIIDPNYIWLAMNSSEIRNQIEWPIRSAVGLKNVNLTEFGALTFRLPPLAEQRRIVAKVNELMALCDGLEVSLTAADTTRRRLLEALLHEALEPAADALEAAE
jgi:type I restriction enzyme S subunit